MNSSEQPPPWVKAFMSPAGWERYRQLREGVGHSDQAITTSAEPAPHTGGVGSSCKTSTQAVPSSLPAQETLEAFTAEIGATIGEPCEKCGCTLYRHLAEYQVCIRCYPPRGYHVYSDRVVLPLDMVDNSIILCNTLQAGFFTLRHLGEAISAWSGSYSTSSAEPFIRPSTP